MLSIYKVMGSIPTTKDKSHKTNGGKKTKLTFIINVAEPTVKSHPFQSVPISLVYFYYVLETFLLPKLKFSFLFDAENDGAYLLVHGALYTLPLSQFLLGVTLLHFS